MRQLFESDSRERAQGRGSADPKRKGGGGYRGFQVRCMCVVDEDAGDPIVGVQRHVALFGISVKARRWSKSFLLFEYKPCIQCCAQLVMEHDVEHAQKILRICLHAATSLSRESGGIP